MATRLRAGTETGSLVNHLQSGMNSAEPEAGIGCTILGWTDRQAATVVEVGKGFVVVQADRAIRTDGNGMSDCQSYLFERNPEGGRYTSVAEPGATTPPARRPLLAMTTTANDPLQTVRRAIALGVRAALHEEEIIDEEDGTELVRAGEDLEQAIRELDVAGNRDLRDVAKRARLAMRSKLAEADPAKLWSPDFVAWSLQRVRRQLQQNMLRRECHSTTHFVAWLRRPVVNRRQRLELP